MANNPYSLIFGQEPEQIITRLSETANVLENFRKERPSQNVYLITGIRGVGKTVFMTEVASKLREDKDWIVIEVSSEGDPLLEVAAELSSENNLAQIFQNAQINLSFWGFGLEVKDVAPLTSIQLAVQKMLESLKKHGKRVLISIDEVISNDGIRKFASVFQILTRKKLPVYLLMTGLYENIRGLQDEKNLTFLYRAPKLELRSLSKRGIADNYMIQFGVAKDTAFEMADITRGYPYAFQVLGYLTWEKKGRYMEVLDEFKKYMADYVYDKIWSELSNKDKKVIYAMAKTTGGKIFDIRQYLEMETNEFNPYRKRLIDKGLITGDKRGYIAFQLPYFEDYVLETYEG